MSITADEVTTLWEAFDNLSGLLPAAFQDHTDIAYSIKVSEVLETLEYLIEAVDPDFQEVD